MNTIFRSPVCEMTELKDLFIELTAKNCNVRCRQCYIDFPFQKSVKDFIKPDVIKQALSDLSEIDLRCIYLIGAEPMTHPDFNSVLRLCLKRSDVCVVTNGSFINEKKTRFLKQVEDEGINQIRFKISFAHYDEIKNDNVRARGSFRQSIYALKCLDKYHFTNIVCVSNYYKEPHNVVIEQFERLLSENGIENVVLQINEWHFGAEGDISEITTPLDCMTGRVLSANGVYSCPFLSNDYRGRMGTDFKDYSKSIRLETSFCSTCQKNKENMFSLDIDF